MQGRWEQHPSRRPLRGLLGVRTAEGALFIINKHGPHPEGRPKVASRRMAAGSYPLVGALMIDQRFAGAAQPDRLDHAEDHVVAAHALRSEEHTSELQSL